MATEAHNEVNGRSAPKNLAPRRDGGKNQSPSSIVDQKGRGKVLALPDDDLGDQDQWSQSWINSMRPRNSFEEFLIDQLAGLSWQTRRIRRAHTARLSTRIHGGEIDALDREETEAIELALKLFGEAGTARESGFPVENGKAPARPQRRELKGTIDADHPTSLVHRLRKTRTGCRWLLDQWAQLRSHLERGNAWLPPDQRKAVCLLGKRPTDAIFNDDVAQVYLAGHRLLNQPGEPFQAILDELSPQEAATYASYLRHRKFDDVIPADATSARHVLMEIADRATAELLDRAAVLAEVAELKAPMLADMLSWDDTPEGDRLRRYEVSCDRAWHRVFDLFQKFRAGNLLDGATIASITHAVPTGSFPAIDRPARVAPAISAEPPTEAKPEPKKAQNEPNFSVQEPTKARVNVTVPTKCDRPCASPRADRGRASQSSFHQELDRQIMNRTSPLLNLSAVTGAGG